MSREIIKTEIAGNTDREVPQFGDFCPDELKPPLPRNQRPDLFDVMAPQSLRLSAINRAIFFGLGIGEPPPVFFPNAEHFQHVPFTHRDWENGNMESEAARVDFMLNKYPNRQFPGEFDHLCSEVLCGPDILKNWSNQAQAVDKAAAITYLQIISKMEESKQPDDTGYHNGEYGAYQSPPAFYDVSPRSGELEKALWDKALAQITRDLQMSYFRNLSSFLHLYNRIKDPITPIRASLPEQVRVFSSLYEEVQSSGYPAEIDSSQMKRLVVQLALESSFLALPAAKGVHSVIYAGHHELPYIDVHVTRLPRGEFADPKRVTKILEEILNESERHQQAMVTPITVAQFQEPYQANPDLLIVDGNNRATAILIMKFINFIGFNPGELLDRDNLRRFITLHDLDIEWERDLVMALRCLTPDLLDYLHVQQTIVKEFALSLAPALLVQESSFHTIAVAQSHGKEIVVLHPAHQTVYHQRRWPMAIPSKQQSHGRAKGNDLLMSLAK